jgi:hypothetical protein
MYFVLANNSLSNNNEFSNWMRKRKLDSKDSKAIGSELLSKSMIYKIYFLIIKI